MTRINRLTATVFFALIRWALETELDPRALSNRSQRLLTAAGLGLLGLFTAFAINGDGGDIAGLAVAGAWSGLILPEMGWIVTGFTAWFTTWMVAAIALADWGLGLGAWSVLFAAAGLAVATGILLVVFVLAIDCASRQMDEEYAQWGYPKPPLITFERLAGGIMILMGVAIAIRFEQQYFDDTAAADLVTAAVGCTIGLAGFSVINYFRQRNKPADGYNAVTDDLWTPIGARSREAPESPSIPT